MSFSPANIKSPSGQAYTVTGYINGQNLVTKVETRVDHAVVGDLLVEFAYSTYQSLNGVQVPARIVQRQAGMQTFDASIDAATPNPPNLTELLTPPPPPAPAGGAPAAPAPAPPAASSPPVAKIGEGVFKIGGNYTSLAVDMGDHILVVESGQNDGRGAAVMAAARQAIPGKTIRFVVNSHAHFDHASGLGAAVAEGSTILTHRRLLLERARSGAGHMTVRGRALQRRVAHVEGLVRRHRPPGSRSAAYQRCSPRDTTTAVRTRSRRGASRAPRPARRARRPARRSRRTCRSLRAVLDDGVGHALFQVEDLRDLVGWRRVDRHAAVLRDEVVVDDVELGVGPVAPRATICSIT